MKIKDFSAMTGLSPSSIRFYDKHGLFELNRSENGYRSFSPEDAFRSNAFRTLFKYGFGVDEAARIVNEKQGCEEFAESLRDHKAHLQREIKELQVRIGHIDRALLHLEDEETVQCTETDEPDFMYARASYGRDFSVAKDARLAIAEYYELLGLTYCTRIITKADLEADTPTLDPSYVISIRVQHANLLSAEARAESNVIELGRCVYFRREAARGKRTAFVVCGALRVPRRASARHQGRCAAVPAVPELGRERPRRRGHLRAGRAARVTAKRPSRAKPLGFNLKTPVPPASVSPQGHLRSAPAGQGKGRNLSAFSLRASLFGFQRSCRAFQGRGLRHAQPPTFTVCGDYASLMYFTASVAAM